MWREYMHPGPACPMANPGGIVVPLTGEPPPAIAALVS